MTATAREIPYVRTAAPAAVPPSLDALLALDVPALEALYAQARVPRLDEVRGDLRGRMLATTVLHGRVADAVRSFASSSSFPWRGKSFKPGSALRGDGINRVILDRWRLYRFETFIGPSRAGDFDALQLDYDNRDNPFFIRPIKDEMRELSSGLWLGQAYLELKGQASLVLYFGLTRQ
ncbi:MAG: hypothetical protein ACLQVI_09680 [Polyangiaceae bacterium]|jgi:hypothetical protein